MDDLLLIKKYYGEKMMHLCRELFPTMLEEPGKLFNLINNLFCPNKYLYEDIVNDNKVNSFHAFIIKQSNSDKVEYVISDKNPFDLMKDAGYTLYECKTEDDIQSFRKYYDKKGHSYHTYNRGIPEHVGEELCTFNGGRLNECYVFFAVKDDVDEINRKDFKNPEREDIYGRSVISVQFSKYDYTLSIKNRYNHAVVNSDATYGNNLENIIPGLTSSFERYFKSHINQCNTSEFELPNYEVFHGKYYKYNYEINNIYYCPDNIIIQNGNIKEFPKERYIVMDYFILDLQEKKVSLFDSNISDEFVDLHKDIDKIKISKNGNDKEITITTKNGIESIITINNKNQIIGYKNYIIEELTNYMVKCKYLNSLELPKVKVLKVGCFFSNSIKKLYLPNLEKMYNECFVNSNELVEIYMPKVKTIGDNCFEYCNKLSILFIPKVKNLIKENFKYSGSIKNVYMPYLMYMGEECFNYSSSIESIYLPNLLQMKEHCFDFTNELTKVVLPKLKLMCHSCFRHSYKLIKVLLPDLLKMEGYCFKDSELIEELDLSSIMEIKECCLIRSKYIKKIIYNKNVTAPKHVMKILKGKSRYIKVAHTITDKIKRIFRVNRVEEEDKQKVYKLGA